MRVGDLTNALLTVAVALKGTQASPFSAQSTGNVTTSRPTHGLVANRGSNSLPTLTNMPTITPMAKLGKRDGQMTLFTSFQDTNAVPDGVTSTRYPQVWLQDANNKSISSKLQVEVMVGTESTSIKSTAFPEYEATAVHTDNLVTGATSTSSASKTSASSASGTTSPTSSEQKSSTTSDHPQTIIVDGTSTSTEGVKPTSTDAKTIVVDGTSTTTLGAKPTGASQQNNVNKGLAAGAGALALYAALT